MTRKIINVALNGVTGRMGYRQHLVRSAPLFTRNRSWSGAAKSDSVR